MGKRKQANGDTQVMLNGRPQDDDLESSDEVSSPHFALYEPN